MEFRQIQYFIKLSERTSISQAAKELFISQQALSKSIKNLESELNTRLFLRTNQGIKLSKSGVYLKSKFLSVCAGYEEAVKESYQYFQIQQGTITIGVAPGVFRSLSANYLINFEKLYPGLKLEQVEFPDLDMEEYVLADSHRFALSTKPWHDRGLQYNPLHREKMFFIAHKEHPLARQKEIHVSQLADENFLFFNSHYNIHYRTKESCKKAGFTPHIIYKSSDVSQLVKMASQKQGILLCVKHVYEESAHENLVCLPIADEGMYWELGIISKNYDKLDKKSKLFIDYFLSCYKNGYE